MAELTRTLPGKTLKKLFGGVAPAPEAPRGPLTAEMVQCWLVGRLAEHLDVAPEEIGIDEPLADYALDSQAAVGLAGELEDLLGRELVPTLLWDHSTIREVVRDGCQCA